MVTVIFLTLVTGNQRCHLHSDSAKDSSKLTWRVELRYDADASQPSVLDHVGHVVHRVHVTWGVGA